MGEATPSPTTVTIQQDNMSLQITPEKLNGSNYSTWSQSVEMYITGRGKVQYLTGKKPKPVETDAAYPKWVEENAMVKSWLLNSMTSNVRAVFLRLPTAHDVWDAVSQTYFIGKDASQMYELRCRAHETRQNGKSLADYYGALQLIWQELDYLRSSAMTCSADAAVQKKEIEEDRLYDFLASLDPSLDPVRSQVLAQDPLPSVRNAFAFVRREELRQATMMAIKFHDGFAMVAGASSRPLPIVPDMSFGNSRPPSVSPGSKISSNRKCTYYQSAQQVSLANASTSSGNTGTSDHMTNDSKLFTLYTTTPRNTVKVANGLSTPVLGAGSIPLSSSLSLSSVLHDILTKKLIGLGRERGGLYYLDLKRSTCVRGWTCVSSGNRRV
uniref:Uncharacterized protein n=1 Tax=Fagus sylvatica TaxID=28930 RepID=A0A2N9EWT2_FAGSY